MWSTVRHIKSLNDCGGIAFLYETGRIAENVMMESRYALFLSGAEPENNAPMRCGACGQAIRWFYSPPLAVVDDPPPFLPPMTP